MGFQNRPGQAEEPVVATWWEENKSIGTVYSELAIDTTFPIPRCKLRCRETGGNG